MMWLGRRRTFWIVGFSLLGLMLLSLALLIGLGLWEGWLSISLNELPAMFWILYAPLVVTSVFLLVVIILIPEIEISDTNLTLVVTNATAALFGAMLTASALLTPTWTGGRLFELTAGAYMLIQGIGSLGRFYLAKRRYQA